jgi:hypothetical protein
MLFEYRWSFFFNRTSKGLFLRRFVVRPHQVRSPAESRWSARPREAFAASTQPWGGLRSGAGRRCSRSYVRPEHHGHAGEAIPPTQDIDRGTVRLRRDGPWPGQVRPLARAPDRRERRAQAVRTGQFHAGSGSVCARPHSCARERRQRLDRACSAGRLACPAWEDEERQSRVARAQVHRHTLLPEDRSRLGFQECPRVPRCSLAGSSDSRQVAPSPSLDLCRN